MIYRKSSPPGTPLAPRRYSFLAPATLKIRLSDGTIESRRFGIGEIIEAFEPSVIYLIAQYEKLTEIPLADGSVIIEYPDDLKVRYVYPAHK